MAKKEYKYEQATETLKWSYVAIVEKTNCNNKNGHYFEVASKEESIEIRKEHPRWVIALWKCIYCKKIKESM